jgi:hypothetical protein
MHSAYVLPHPCGFPENLRFKGMENSYVVNMNEVDREGVSKMYSIPIENVKCIYNAKDFRSFNNFHPLSWDISKKLKLMDKEVVQILPFCTTRIQAKGFYDVTLFFSCLKKMGVSIGLILANSHASKVPHIIEHEKKRMRQLGLIEGEDYLWTSDYAENGQALPRECVSDLFSCSNLFVYGSWRENCPNVLLEARIGGVLCVLNESNAVFKEFAPPNTIWYQGEAKTPGLHDGARGEMIIPRYPNGKLDYFTTLAKKVLANIPDLSYKWEYCYERIWNDQLKPMLYG